MKPLRLLLDILLTIVKLLRWLLGDPPANKDT